MYIIDKLSWNNKGCFHTEQVHHQLIYIVKGGHIKILSSDSLKIIPYFATSTH